MPTKHLAPASLSTLFSHHLDTLNERLENALEKTGYDSMVIAGLGLDKEAARSYITNEKPTYTQFEAWIQAQDGVTLGDDAIGKLNSDIAGYNHDADTKAGILSATGLSEGPDDAINLNNLDDWQEFHAAEIAG